MLPPVVRTSPHCPTHVYKVVASANRKHECADSTNDRSRCTEEVERPQRSGKDEEKTFQKDSSRHEMAPR